jgi:hypothetical protein
MAANAIHTATRIWRSKAFSEDETQIVADIGEDDVCSVPPPRHGL